MRSPVDVMFEKHCAILQVREEIQQLRQQAEENERRYQYLAMLACWLMLGAMLGIVIAHAMQVLSP